MRLQEKTKRTSRVVAATRVALGAVICAGITSPGLAEPPVPDLADLTLEQLGNVVVTSVSRREERLIEASARAIVKQSLEGLHENVKIRSEAYRAARAPAAAAPREEEAPTPPSTTNDEEPATAAPPPDPELVLKKADPHALAATVAREVARTLVPLPVLLALLLGGAALVVWLVVR